MKTGSRRIFGPKRAENEGWRRLHNEELNNMYHSPNTVRVVKSIRRNWAGLVTRMEEGRSAFKIFTGIPAGKRLLGRPQRRWEDVIIMDLKEISIIRGIELIVLRTGITGEPL